MGRREPPSFLALVPAALLAACAASPNPQPAAAWPGPVAPAGEDGAAARPALAAGRSGAGPTAATPRAAVAREDAGRGALPTVARVGAEVIDVGELLGVWMHANPSEVRELLDGLVSAAAVELEARRIGLALDPEEIALGYAQAVARLEAGIARSFPEATLDEWISAGLGLEPDSYKRRLRDDVRRGLLAERVVRAFVLSNEHVLVRMIVSEERAQSEAIRRELDAGASFDELAAERSIAPPEALGGPTPVLHTRTGLSRMAFLTGVGELGGPFEEQGRWMILRVDAHAEPLAGETWPQLGPAVEKSLVERPVVEPEYLQWTAAVLSRYEVDLAPFFRLIGEVDG